MAKKIKEEDIDDIVNEGYAEMFGAPVPSIQELLKQGRAELEDSAGGTLPANIPLR